MYGGLGEWTSKRKPQRGLVGWTGSLMSANRIRKSAVAEVSRQTHYDASTFDAFLVWAMPRSSVRPADSALF